MSTYYLPPEVLREIISHVRSTKTLKSLALVSRAAHEFMIPVLLEHIVMCPTVKALEQDDSPASVEFGPGGQYNS